mgnify:FL=1
MKSSSLTSTRSLVRSGNGIGAGLLRRAVLRQLQNLHHGLLVIHEAGDSLHFGNPQAHLRA